MGVLSVVARTAARRRRGRRRSAAPDPSTAGVREVSASARSVIPLQTRVRFTTMIVLPEGEEILDVVCGDKEFWVISATHNMAHVKPAKEGTSTNLNLVTGERRRLFVPAHRAGRRGDARSQGVRERGPECRAARRPKFYSAAEVERLQGRTDGGACRDRGGRTPRHRDDRRAASRSTPRACSSSTARRSTPSPSWCGPSGTTASSPTSRPTRRSCRRSTN